MNSNWNYCFYNLWKIIKIIKSSEFFFFDSQVNVCKNINNKSGIKTKSVDEISIIVCWDFPQTTNMPNKQTKPTYIKENGKVNNNFLNIFHSWKHLIFFDKSY